MGKQVLGNQTAPATPAVGTTAIYVDSADKHTKQIDDAGVVIDLATVGAGIDNQFVQARRNLGNQVFAGAGPTKIIFDSSIGVITNFDNVNDRLIVPAGGTGTYQLTYNAGIVGNNSDATSLEVQFYKNGGITNIKDVVTLPGVANSDEHYFSKTFALDLVAGDFVEVFVTIVGATTFNMIGRIESMAMSFTRMR